MGHNRHHAIVVTSWDVEKLKIVHEYAKNIFAQGCSEIVSSHWNSYDSFFIAPDGSKEGWPESEKGDSDREFFIDFIRKQVYEDGSSSIRFVELFYGDDNGESKIVTHN